MLSKELSHDGLATFSPRLGRLASDPQTCPPLASGLLKIHCDVPKLRSFIELFSSKSSIKLLYKCQNFVGSGIGTIICHEGDVLATLTKL